MESGALLGLLLGIGLLLIWRSGSRAPRPRSDTRGPGRRQVLLAEAGLTGINAAQLLALQVGLGLIVLVVVLTSPLRGGSRPAPVRVAAPMPCAR